MDEILHESSYSDLYALVSGSGLMALRHQVENIKQRVAAVCYLANVI